MPEFKNEFADKIGKFIEDIKPFLDDSFESINIAFNHNGKAYEFNIYPSHDEEFDKMIDELKHNYDKHHESDKDLN